MADLRRERADAAGLRLRLGLRDLDQLAALGRLGVARGEHALLLGHGLRARLVGGGLRLGLELRLLGDGDGALLLGELDGLAPLDLEGFDLALARDPVLLDRALGGDARALDHLAGLDLRALGLLLLDRLLARHVGALPRARHLQLALLLQARVLEVAVDVERLALGVQVLVANLDHGVLLDVVPLLLARFDGLGEARQALGVEGVRGVEEFHRGLVELGERDRLELETVLQQVGGHHGAHALHVLAALLVHLLHGHLRGHRAERVDELALHQLLQELRLHGALTERLRRRRDRLRGRLHPHVELRGDVHAHAVLGDDRALAAPGDLEAERVHVHRDHLVDDRQHERAAVQHDALPTEAGAHERPLLRGAQIEPVEQPRDDRDDRRDDDEGQDEHSDLGPSHDTFSLPMRLNARVVSVNAVSVGRRSMLEAP